MSLQIKTKLDFKKKYIAFFAIVPLLMISSLTQIKCPVCKGTGSVSSTGMSMVSVTSFKATNTGIYLAVCGTYRVYMTDIALTLQNDGEIDANGYVSMILVDYTKGQVLTTQMVQVQVPANMKVDTLYSIYFQVNVDDPTTVKVNAKVNGGNTPDIACNGKGKIALNSWLLTNSMKGRFLKAQTLSTVTPVFQPFFLPPEDWDVPGAYDKELPGQGE